jgi:phage shock protein PspC (stress-responsive transcriptional regulator)
MAASDPLPAPADSPRRLTRSTTDKYVSGVAGGLGRYFGIDATLFRIAFGVSMLFGGVGIVAYLAMIAFLPTDDGQPAWIEGRSRTTTIVLTVLLVIAGFSMLSPPGFLLGPGLFVAAGLSVLGVALYRAFGGERSDDPARIVARATLVLLVLAAALAAATGIGFIAAIGGGTAIAAIAILAGIGLIVAGLFGGPRWLILPVMVLVMPLAVVSAADIDLRGGVDQREFRPSSVEDLQPEYRLGMGQMVLDLRDVTLPPGRTQVNLRLGVGEAIVRVPDGACAATEAEIGVGEAELPGQSPKHGFDIDVDQSGRAPGARPQLLVVADVGVGHLQVDQFGDCA